MTPKDLQTFSNTALDWYEKNGRHDLPWRKKSIAPYEVWVSEIMLQQTQVSRVIPFYQNFLKRFPNVSALSRASWKEFLPYYRGLGYYRRGENMLKAARIVASEYGGQFPRSEKELRKLPGIGEYTAKAILAFAFNENVLAPDTNIKRIFTRYFPGSKEEKIFEKAERFLTASNISARKFNSALMDFGSLVCVSRPVPETHSCPFGKKCQCFVGVCPNKTITKKERFPWNQARAYVFVHENHQRYFSKTKKNFTPFILPRGQTSRETIKTYFRNHYALELSVRPPFAKISSDEEPKALINAQILTGKNPFFAHAKEGVQKYKEQVKSL